MSKIYLFRHAQASIGKANYDVLSPKGELQAEELGKFLCEENLILLFRTVQKVVLKMLCRLREVQEK